MLLLARDVHTARQLGALFAAGTLHKQYRALVRGWPADAGQTDTPLARDPERPSTGQPLLPASTRWQVLHRLELPLAGKSTMELGYLNQYVKNRGRADDVDHVLLVTLQLRR